MEGGAVSNKVELGLEIDEIQAGIERLRGEVARLEREVVNRNQRALDGDKAVATLNTNIDLYEQMKAERDALKSAAEKGTEYVLAQINQDLRAENDKLLNKRKRDSHNMLNKIKALHTAVDLRRKAEAERDAAVADAERYRYAKEHLYVGHYYRESFGECMCEFESMDDAAIDAARGEK
jgi:regulator of protease activity HflC (stomatin/prohibitin superfamily)